MKLAYILIIPNSRLSIYCSDSGIYRGNETNVYGNKLSFAPVIVVLFACLMTACVSFPDAPVATTVPSLSDGGVLVSDGVTLPTRRWAAQDPKAVLIALHGMNDYGNSFALPAKEWAAAGIETIAYDQRGFGAAPDRGIWVGSETLKADLRSVIGAVRAERPHLPVFVVGHSMGGAVVLAASGDDVGLDVDGIILAAPAIWGGPRMPWFYRLVLNTSATLLPRKTLTGERVGRQPTDNLDVWRAMANDPLMIGPTRLDATLGLVRLMGDAWDATEGVSADAIVLIGEKDEIIPPKDMKAAATRLTGDVDVRTYDNGWHLLFRDLDRSEPTSDVIEWITAHSIEKKSN
ncbi:MAG: lysophospholipase [Pseudomonadota bacterium]